MVVGIVVAGPTATEKEAAEVIAPAAAVESCSAEVDIAKLKT